jgi:hypothetical protein
MTAPRLLLLLLAALLGLAAGPAAAKQCAADHEFTQSALGEIRKGAAPGAVEQLLRGLELDTNHGQYTLVALLLVKRSLMELPGGEAVGDAILRTALGKMDDLTIVSSLGGKRDLERLAVARPHLHEEIAPLLDELRRGEELAAFIRKRDLELARARDRRAN